MHLNDFIHSSVIAHLICFQLLVIVNNAMHIGLLCCSTQVLDDNMRGKAYKSLFKLEENAKTLGSLKH